MNVNTVEQMARALATLVSDLETAGYADKNHSLLTAKARLADYLAAKEREQQDERCMVHGERIRYNGYANYETWAVSLWIDNERGSYDSANEMVAGAGNVFDAARQLQAEYDEDTPELEGVWADLLGHAVNRVDWVEVAREHKPDEWGDSDTAPDVPSTLTFDDSDYWDE